VAPLAHQRAGHRLAPLAALLVSALLVSWSGGAAGQEAPSGQEGGTNASAEPAPGIEEITVMGQRRADALKEAPVSVTAFTMEDLAAQGTSDIRGLANFTPNLEIKTAFAASNPTLFIRGVGLKDYFANSSSAVAVYNDDIYMNSPTGQLFQLFDLENVEVLRGPQGSLYGRNASAGVIRAISRKPTGDFNGYFNGSYGSYNLVELESALEWPLIENELSIRGAYRLNMRDGVGENRCARDEYRFQPPCTINAGQPLLADVEQHVNDVNNWAARGVLRWTPNPDLDVVLIAGGGLNRSLARQNQKIGTSEDPQTGRKVAGNRDGAQYRDPDTCTPGKCQRVRPQFAFPTTPGEANPLDGDPYKGDYNLTGNEHVDVFLSSLTATYETGDIALTSVSGYAANKRDTLDNSDASPRFQVETKWYNKAWQASQDLRGQWQPTDDLILKSGAFFLTEQLDVENLFEFPSFSDTGRTGIEQLINQDTYTWSVFGYGTWSISDNLTADAGLRYNWDQKKFTADSNTLLGTIFFKGPSETQKEISKGFSGDITLSYRFFDGLQAYAKYGHGFKAGQFNGAAGLGNFDIDLVQFVDPETVDAYEVGAKSSFLDGQVQVNVSSFFYRYNDLQVFVLDNSLATLPTPRLVNANDAQVWGVEGEFRVRPFSWLELFTTAGFLESKYLDFTDTVNTVVNQPTPELVKDTVDYSGNRLINSPALSLSGSAVVDIPLGGLGWLTPRFDFSYKTRTFFDPNEGRGQFGLFPKGTLAQDALLLVNARIAYRTPDQRIEIAGFVRNLTDEQYAVDGFDLSSGFDSLNFVIGDPRLYGVNVSYRF